MSADVLVRQPSEVVDRLRVALDEAREARDVARDAHDLAAHLLAGAALHGYDAPEEWKERYVSTERALGDARVAHHAARVEWYHSIGKHAHSSDLTLCCQSEDADA